MLISRIILDDFFDDPHAVRAQALGLEYPEPAPGTFYPGRTSRLPLKLPGADGFFSKVCQQPLAGMAELGHMHVRYSIAAHERRGDVHIDPGAEWSGIIYLTLDEHCHRHGGTRFYRHKATGAEGRPRTDAEAEARYGFESRVAFLEATIKRDGKTPEAWEVIDEVPMRFNRCILFRPWFFHAGGDDFGTGMEDGRLVQLLFFKQAQRPPGAG